MLLTSQGSKSSSITDNGYVILDNGLIIQWGKTNAIPTQEILNRHVFSIPFPHKCFTISLTTDCNYTTGWYDVDVWVQLASYDRTGFSFAPQAASLGWDRPLYAHFIAIGY